MARRLAILAALALLAGCGSDQIATVTRPVETTDPPAKLPAGWQTYISRDAGFSIGVPPGWTTRAQGITTVLTSPDNLVAISASADRTDAALAEPLARYTLGTAESLSGFKSLRVLGHGRFPAHYPGYAANVRGVAGDGVSQTLFLVILRHTGIAAFPILTASNARKGSVFLKQVNQIVRSLRDRPIEGD